MSLDCKIPLAKTKLLFYNYYHMSSISQTESQFILENKPYLTKAEMATLLDKEGRNLDKKILQLLKKGSLLSLKKGFYSSKEYIEKQPPQAREYLANILYYPSYLSLEYALAKEGLIPEAVYVYTSIALKPTQTFTNSLGTFIYRSIKPDLFSGYTSTRFTENYQIKIASRAKALFDLLYLKVLPDTSSGKRQVIADLRINWSLVNIDDLREFQGYVEASQSPKMKQVSRIVSKQIL